MEQHQPAAIPPEEMGRDELIAALKASRAINKLLIEHGKSDSDSHLRMAEMVMSMGKRLAELDAAKAV